ncbi:MAG: hypothetical protein N2Z57_05840, partial [Oscillospiraceae bacterium]|nr:hypothetical protein [Oscillospiraceae bacterium]
MKTTKMIVGIISIVLSVLVTFQSCAAGAYNAMTSNGESSGTAGLFVAILMLVAGIIGIAARKSKGGSFTAMAFYILSGIIGLAGAGSYK